MPWQPLFSDEAVLQMRRRFKARFPKLDIKTLAFEHKIKPPAMRRLLIGETYARVPEAVPRRMLLLKPVHNRSLTMSQVVSARQRFDREEVTVNDLSAELKINASSIVRMLDGRNYADVPFASRRATANLAALIAKKGASSHLMPGGAKRRRRLRAFGMGCDAGARS